MVNAPRDAVELEFALQDLSVGSDREKVETLHLILAGTNGWKVPLPEDLIAAGDVDSERLDVRDRSAVRGAGDVLLPAIDGRSAELDESQLIGSNL